MTALILITLLLISIYTLAILMVFVLFALRQNKAQAIIQVTKQHHTIDQKYVLYINTPIIRSLQSPPLTENRFKTAMKRPPAPFMPMVLSTHNPAQAHLIETREVDTPSIQTTHKAG